jgi:gliding motility-associated-like protein
MPLTTACGGNPILPDLTFRIEKTDGTLLQSYNSNSIPTNAVPTWVHYGFFFTMPAGVPDVVLRILNNAPGGCGNDLALDDITFRPCGPLLTPVIIGSPVTNVAFCQGTAQSYQFNCTVSGGFNNPSFQWQQNINNGGWTDIAGANGNNYLANYTAAATPGTYNYRLAVAESGNINSLRCRVISPLITVLINPLPVTAASNNGPACANSSLQLHAGGGGTYIWTGPAGFISSLANPVIANVQAGNAGKYYVQVTTAAGCTKTDSTIVLVNPSPVAFTAFSDSSICEGSSVTLIGSGGTAWQWTPATGLSSANIINPIATPTDTTVYFFIARNSFNCTDTAFTKVNLIKRPLVNAGPDRQIIAGNSIRLNGTVTGQYSSFSWSPLQYINDPLILQPLINPPASTYYVLQAAAINSCGLSADTVFIHVFAQLFIPNAFTPNDDSKNDNWNIPALATYDNFELAVFNRYGQLVFRTVNINKPWDGKYKGKVLPAGAYAYFLDLKNGFDPIRGSVLLIR